MLLSQDTPSSPVSFLPSILLTTAFWGVITAFLLFVNQFMQLSEDLQHEFARMENATLIIVLCLPAMALVFLVIFSRKIMG